MKHFSALSLVLMLGFILGACGTTDNQETTEKTEQTNEQESEPASSNPEKSGESSGENGSVGEEIDLESGIETVIKSVEQLNASLEDSDPPKDIRAINERGKALEEDWDRIEKNVEKKYPDQYKKIEESLYPLIAEAKKEEQPHIDKMKQLTESTLDSLRTLQQTLEHQ